MNFNSAKLEMWAQQLLTAAAMIAPDKVAAARAALGVVKGLTDGLRSIREDDPELWDKISDGYNDALGDLRESIERREAAEAEREVSLDSGDGDVDVDHTDEK